MSIVSDTPPLSVGLHYLDPVSDLNYCLDHPYFLLKLLIKYNNKDLEKQK